MLVEKIKQIATDREFVFKIGDEEWQNLIDAKDDVALPFAQKKVHLLLFQEKESRTYGSFSIENRDERSATFLLAVRSKISDTSFDYKYDNHIKPLKDLARDIENKDFGICDDLELKSYSIEGWRENFLDTNFDCVEVRISVEYNG